MYSYSPGQCLDDIRTVPLDGTGAPAPLLLTCEEAADVPVTTKRFAPHNLAVFDLFTECFLGTPEFSTCAPNSFWGWEGL